MKVRMKKERKRKKKLKRGKKEEAQIVKFVNELQFGNTKKKGCRKWKLNLNA